MSLIMGQIEPKHFELFALEFGKFAEYFFVYTLASTNINQSTPNLVCYVHTQLFLALYMCVFIFGFPCGYF